MTTPITYTYRELPRDEVIGYLGSYWPPQPGTTVARISAVVAVTHGALAVHTTPGQPGRTWWAVDGLIPTQAWGPPPDLPGCPVATIPYPDVLTPPLTP